MPLTPTGYTRKRLEEFLSEIKSSFNQEFGTINTASDSLLGQFIAVISEQFNVIEQKLENVYFSQYIATAEGVSLDNAVQNLNITRIAATASTAVVVFFGDANTTINAGIQVQKVNNGAIFTTDTETDISTNNVVRAEAKLPSTSTGTVYSIIINGFTFSYTALAPDTPDDVVEALVTDINNSTDVDIDATNEGSGTIRLDSGDLQTNFNLTLDSNFTATLLGTGINVTAQQTGPIEVLKNTITQIVNPVTGLDSVDNLAAGVEGRDRETDNELRQRALRSSASLSRATESAIRIYVEQNVDGVTSVAVFSNRSTTTQNGRPPKSFETIVQGGDDNAVANAIYEVGPAGIEAFGDTVVNLDLGDDGGIIPIGFTRPTSVYVWVQVTLTVISNQFPQNGLDAVAANLKEAGDDVGVGEDVLWQTFFEAIYEVNGITNANLQFATSATPGGPAGAYSSNNITISESEVPEFSLDRITVTS